MRGCGIGREIGGDVVVPISTNSSAFLSSQIPMSAAIHFSVTISFSTFLQTFAPLKHREFTALHIDEFLPFMAISQGILYTHYAQ